MCLYYVTFNLDQRFLIVSVKYLVRVAYKVTITVEIVENVPNFISWSFKCVSLLCYVQFRSTVSDCFGQVPRKGCIQGYNHSRNC